MVSRAMARNLDLKARFSSGPHPLHPAGRTNERTHDSMPLSPRRQNEYRRRTKPDPGSITMGERVLIIVPAFNEAGSLPALMDELKKECPGCDVVVIDDGSSDGTREVVAGMVRVVSLPCNLGIGGAVQTGLQIAQREGYDLAIQVDGDGQHPPRELYKLIGRPARLRLRPSGRLAIPCCRRRIQVHAHPAHGHPTFFVYPLGDLPDPITDPTSGFRVMNHRAIRVLSHRYSEDYPEVEALVVAHRAGLRVSETSVHMAERTAGTSSIGSFKSLIYMLKVPLAIFMDLLRKPEIKFRD